MSLPAHATGRCGDHHYLEMEYVAGQSLQKEIDSRGPIGPIRSTQMAVGIAEGLAAAHRLGIIHRDLKPDNVLVTPGGQPKIVDFGLAKLVVTDDLNAARLVGTPHFMAPELFEGSDATTASDVFALGVCYYLMLTSHFPFEGNSFHSLMNAVLAGDYVSVRTHQPDIPLDMAECVGLMLSRSPENRPRDGGAVSQLLQAVLGSIRDLDTLVHEAFNQSPNVSVNNWARAFACVCNCPTTASKQSILKTATIEPGSDSCLSIASAARHSKDFYEAALRLNSEVLHGGLAIRDIEGQASFVMVDTFPARQSHLKPFGAASSK